LHFFEILKHHGLNGFEWVRCVCHGISPLQSGYATW
jgi:hypothetical protein